MDPRLLSLEQELVERHLAFHPGAALALGVHRHDRELEDFTGAAVERYCAFLDDLRARALALGGLAGEDEVERDVLLARVEGTLHEYRELASTRRDPYFHADALSGQLNLAVIFAWAPPEERMAAVAAKERQVPRFCAAVRAELGPVPPALRAIGVVGFEGALSLVEKDLPAAFAGAGAPAARAEFEAATGEAAAALRGLVAWLRDEAPAAPERAYALGEERYRGWLRAMERVETPLPELERWALDGIEQARAALQGECRRIDGTARPDAVLARLVGQHPATGRLVAEATRIADDVYAWLEKSGLVTLPTRQKVRIAETPEFMRWSFGSMWTPGPYETAPGLDAVFYATDADPAWPAERQEEHLTAFSYRGLENLAVHEAYPGHFIQGLHQNRVDSPVRKSFWWGVFGEGWAHYCELLAVEEGFGGGHAEVRIAQLQEALNRLCRFVNGIRLHTRPDWGVEEGARFFAERAWLAPAVARAECERGTFDPFYLRYTLGKKEILELREECRSALGARFDLRRFHDTLLGCGSGPMPSLRRLVRLRLGIG